MKKTVVNQRGGWSQIRRHKDKMRQESFTLLALLGCILLILGGVRLINSVFIPGLSKQVVFSIPIHLTISGIL